MTPAPETDTIIDEIHQTRRQIYSKFDGDIAAILDDARKRQADSGRPVWAAKTSQVMPSNHDATAVVHTDS